MLPRIWGVAEDQLGKLFRGVPNDLVTRNLITERRVVGKIVVERVGH